MKTENINSFSFTILLPVFCLFRNLWYSQRMWYNSTGHKRTRRKKKKQNKPNESVSLNFISYFFIVFIPSEFFCVRPILCPRESWHRALPLFLRKIYGENRSFNQYKNNDMRKSLVAKPPRRSTGWEWLNQLFCIVAAHENGIFI